MKTIRFGSVCSGIEAASVAWNPLGWKAAWLSEIEPFPSAVLAHHYPDVPNLGDMTKLPGMIRAGDVEAPDVFCGGTPCQAFSIAGLRKSLDDARGNLSLVFCEIADAIDSIRLSAGDEPAIIFWENVPGVLSTSDNAFGCFLAGLAGEDDPLEPPGGKWTNAGYVLGPQRAVAWRVTDAQYFGVAQRRRRVFVVASARDGFDPAAVLFEFEGVRRDTPPSREAGEGAAAGTLRGTDGGSDVGHARAWHLATVEVCPTLRAGGNRTGGDRPPGTDVDTADSLQVITMAHGQGGAEIGFDRGPTLTCNHEAPIAAYPVAHVDTMPCMTAGGPADTSHNQISGQMREQYVVPVCVTGQVTHTLKAEGFDASEDGTGRGQPIVVHGTQDPCHDEHVAFALGRNSGQENAIAFQTLGSNLDVGEISGTIGTNADRASGSAPCIAFSCKDHGGDAGPISPTLRSMGHDGSHANAGGQVAVAFFQGEQHASAQETHPGTLLRTLRQEVGEEAFAKWGLGILDSLQQAEVLRQALHGTRIRRASGEKRFVLDDGSLQRPEDLPAGAMRSLWEDGPDGCSPQGRELAKQLARELGAPLPFLPHEGAQKSGMMVRRLTPVECSRLQGFPDDYLTQVQWRGKVPPPDGPMYKALGNSWAVPNVRWIGRRIDAQLRACAGSISKPLVTEEA